MTDKSKRVQGETDTASGEQVQEGMQGATGAMNANGMDSQVSAEEKLQDLSDNLSDVQKIDNH